MRVVLQRVLEAEVVFEGEVVGACGPGFTLLVGFGQGDDVSVLAGMARKICELRIFSDDRGRFHFNLKDVLGSVLVIPNFTLYADMQRGQRPSFSGALEPGVAEQFFVKFCGLVAEILGEEKVARGIFGADMKVSLCNDGPVTLILDSAELFI